MFLLYKFEIDIGVKLNINIRVMVEVCVMKTNVINDIRLQCFVT